MMGPITTVRLFDLSRGDYECPPNTVGIYIGWGGHLTVQFRDGSVSRLDRLRKGRFLMLRIARVLKRGTSCRKMYLLLD